MICKAAIGAAAASLLRDITIDVQVQSQDLFVIIGQPAASVPFNEAGVILGTPNDHTSSAWNTLGIINGVPDNVASTHANRIGVINGVPNNTGSVSHNTLGVIRGVAPNNSTSSAEIKLGVIIMP